MPSLLALVSLTMLAEGCALTSKADSVVIRYFTPESLQAASTSPGGTGQNLQLRLGRVNAAAHIRDRIAFRDASHEVGYYDELRWAEKPESFLRRALARALFEQAGVQQLIGRTGPTLEVELAAFEEVRAPRHVARVQITWLLRDDQTVQTQKTFVVERPIPTSNADSVADSVAGALADAVGEAVKTVVDGTLSELSRAKPPVAER